MYIPADDGRWVDENFARLAEVVQDYNSTLRLAWIPPERRSNPEDELNPYCIIDTRTNTIVIHATITDTPQDILGRLFDADNARGNVLDRLENKNRAAKILEHKAWMDKLDDAAELATYMIKSPLNYMKLHDPQGNVIKLDDQRRRLE